MDCIAAIATPLAPSAIGILRLSGDGAVAVAERVFHPANGRDFAEHSPWTMVYGAVETAEGTLLDHGLGVWFSAAHSYTGEEAVELARMGLLPAGMYRNRSFAEAQVDPGATELCRQDLLYDPQTAGGLLMAVDPADAEALYRELQGCVPSAQRIGVVKAYRGGKRIFLW